MWETWFETKTSPREACQRKTENSQRETNTNRYKKNTTSREIFLKTLYTKLFKNKKGESKQIDINELKVVKTIGKGGFGETVLVQDTNTGKMYIGKESISGQESIMRYQYNM